MVDIVEFVANPETPKTVEKEGNFFFEIVSNMMNVNLNPTKHDIQRRSVESFSEEKRESPASRWVV